ncbi:RagB/SusD family nutrient uptake outer membrane protein [Flavisericum labens]|uniref:RagB/SusD family nutrient uptake outer membrane protein n=1 Tax=Flavisericum labens TaxID=3377112 RepID=UPI00387B5836
MKILKYIFFSVTMMLMNASCEDDLNLAPEDQNTSAGFYRNAADLEAAVNAMYGALQRDGLYGYNYHILLETRSDNTFEEEPSNSGGFGDMDLFNRVTTNPVITSTWRDSYIAIQTANIVLNRIDAITDMDQATKATRKGEARFIRALIYYNLVNLYGDVPLVTQETTNPTDFFGQGRTSKAEVFAQIITDLSEAQNELPESNDTGRATKGAANALLGKVYLTNGNPQAAETALRAVTGYTLLNNYADNFGVNNENGSESIFEIQFKSDVNGNSEGSKFATRFSSQANPGSRGNNIITEDLASSFEAGDLRRDEIVPDASTSTVFISTKYIDDDQPVVDDGDNNVIVLRYADVLLMLAEALNAQGYAADGEAFDLLNQIRTRAGLASLTSATVTNQTEFITALLEERRHELFHEPHRWLDIKRLGDPISIMNTHFDGMPSTANITINQEDLLLPIPQAQIDSDPDSMSQNPGY